MNIHLRFILKCNVLCLFFMLICHQVRGQACCGVIITANELTCNEDMLIATVNGGSSVLNFDLVYPDGTEEMGVIPNINNAEFDIEGATMSGNYMILFNYVSNSGLDPCSCNFQMTENTTPPVANPVMLTVCGNDANMGFFDLSELRNDIDNDGNGNGIADNGDAGHLVTFHETQAQADAGMLNIDTSLPYSTSGGIIYSRLEAVNGNGCFSVKEVTLNVNLVPMFNINLTPNETTITCDLNTITAEAVVNGQGTYTYDWNNIGGMNDPSSTQITASGTYTVMVTDENMCSTTKQVIINENTLPPVNVTATASGTLACNNQPVTLTGGSGTQDVDYSWTGPNNFTGTGMSIDVSAIGLYTLTVTRNDNGCTDTATVMVTGSPMPVPTISPSSLTLTCTQTEITLMGSASGGVPNYTYSWSTGVSGEMIDVTTPNTYSLTVTDNNGCMGTTSVEIGESTIDPTPIIPTPDTLTCDRTTVTLNASGSTVTGTPGYDWGNGNTGATLGVDMPGTYMVTITDNANGCTAIGSATVVQNITPPTASNANVTSCDNNNSGMGEFNLTQADADVGGQQGVSSVTYHTTMANAESGNDPIPSPYTSGDTIVFARLEFDNTGCHEVSEVTLTLAILQAPTISYTPSLQGLCDDRQVITVSVENPLPDYTYTWSVNGSLDGVENEDGCAALELMNTGGTTNVVLTYALGTCSNQISESPTWSNTSDPNTKILRIGQTNTLFCNRNDFDSYQWGREDKITLCPEELVGEVYQNYVSSGLDTDNYYYWVIVKDSMDCTQKLYYADDPFMKIIPEEPVDYGDLHLQVIPNPNDGTFQLELTGNDDKALDIHLYDALGREVYYRQFDKLNFVERVPVAISQLNSGMYFVRITGNQGILLTEKIIIK